MDKPNFLFSFVGKQDPVSPKNREEGSIITLVRFLKPDVVYLLPTSGGLTQEEEANTEKNGEEVKTFLMNIRQEIKPEMRISLHPIILPNPTDYADILFKTKQILRPIIDSLQAEKFDIHLNCSSGTPQLKSAWLILAAYGFFPSFKLWQVVEPRFAKNGIRVMEIKIDFLEEEIRFKRLESYLQKHLFLSAREEAESLSKFTTLWEKRKKIALLSRLMEAYHLWDSIRYEEARATLDEILEGIKNTREFQELEPLLKEQSDQLENIQGTVKENPNNLKDLYFNAKRCFEKGEYADTLSRFWRLYEGLLFYRLREKYQIEPNDVESSPGDKKEEVLAFLQGQNSQPKKISRSGAEDILIQVLKDPVMVPLWEERAPLEFSKENSPEPPKLKNLIKEMVDTRNNSIVAHGMRPVKKEEAEKALKIAALLIQKLTPEIDLENEFLPPEKASKILSIFKN